MTIRPVPRSLAAALLLAACSGNGATTPGPTSGADTFLTNSLSRYQQSSLGSPGSWEIAAGVLTATGPANQSVLIRRDAAFADGYVEATASRADDGGVVLRFAGETSYYLLAFRDDAAPHPRGQRNLAIYRRSPSEFTELRTVNIHWPRGTEKTIRFQVVGPTLRVFVDGIPVDEVDDPFEPLPPGRVGLRHYGDSASWMTVFHALRWAEAAAQ